MRVIIFIVLVININWLVEPVHGFTCSNIEPLKNFQAEKITGIWYAIARNPSKYDIKYKCIKTNITLEIPNSLHFHISAIRTDDNMEISFNGVAEYNGDKSVSNFTSHTLEIYPNYRFNEIIFATDYNSYQIYYSCNEQAEIEYCWAVTRSRIIEDELWEKIISIANKFKIKKRYLIQVDNTDCFN